MIYCVLLTKCYDKDGFLYWYRWHSKFIDHFIIFDNESSINFKTILLDKCEIHEVKGWANQYQLYTDILNSKRFNDGDYIVFIDDDEYIVNETNNLTEYLDNMGRDLYHLPEILFSTKELQDTRDYSVPIYKSHTYRRNDLANTIKSIVKYNHNNTYDFLHSIDCIGHKPMINGEFPNSYGFGSFYDDRSVNSYAMIDYNAPIRLNHYHIRSREEWDIKVKRGSAATMKPWYSNKIEDNYAYGGYDILSIK